MREIKNTVRARVRIAYDGKVYKTFHGTDRETRYATEVAVLQHLKNAGCDFVPELVSHDDEILEICTTNCGAPVEKMSEEKMQSLFTRLEEFGVRHGDQFLRNITYCGRRGHFCVIDFELAEILDGASPPADTPPTGE